MIAHDNASLTGHWTGVYDYPHALGHPVPFNAVLTESAGALSGESVEPNTFSPDRILELFASLSGERAGAEVSFVKTYEPATRAAHRVRYRGVANADLTRIEGAWSIVGGAPGWCGPFVMNRADSGQAVAIAGDVAAENRD